MPSPPQDSAPPQGVDALRLALAELIAGVARDAPSAQGACGVPDGELLRQIRTVCRSARDAGLPVERMIVLLKQSWIPDTDAGLSGRTADARLSALVSACITSYYDMYGEAG